MSQTSVKPLELVVSAIHCLREKKGSSLHNILKYLSGKYNVDTELLKVHVQTGLRRGVSFGFINHNSGLYRLNKILSAPLTKERPKFSLKAAKPTKKKKLSKPGEKRREQNNFKCCSTLKKNAKRMKHKTKKPGISSRRNHCQKLRKTKQHKAKGKKVQKTKSRKIKKTRIKCSHPYITEPPKPEAVKEPDVTTNDIMKT